MQKNINKLRHFLLVAGLSVSTLAVATASGAMIVHDGDDDKKAEQAEKKEKRTIRVIRSGGDPVVVRSDRGHTVIASSHGMEKFEKANRAAIKKAQAALNEVSARLEKAKSKGEKKALIAAQKGLVAAIESLEEQRIRHVFEGPSRVEIARIESEAMAEALDDLRDSEGDFAHMRIELKQELAEAREEIEEALGDIDIEIDTDGDVRRLRIESLKSAKRSLEEMERQQLDELKRAEEEIKRERERLEKRLEERKKEAEQGDQ